uniref:RPAP1/MINIYO-like TPR repeats domain-containing protein n=1 Tax=Kalmanozyma brasiliensis (strain GHG001) TaxID=1365824 RepID=V5E7Z4_KALBG
MPSLTAVRLLHQGILSNREVGKAIVSSGNVEHLLRFIVTQPWKVENDSATNDEAGNETSHEEADNDEEEDDERDVDPITGSKLWKCPASGLPIRPDWPLLALDDLLHSGSTAVFNRPNNLGEDWKPSELEMVRASLKLAVAVFRGQLDHSKVSRAGGVADTDDTLAKTKARAMLGSLPSPEQILLGVMKVFMLEKDQADTFTDKTASGATQQKQSGVLTGRDLFRDSTISQELTSLLGIADELVQLRRSHSDSNVMSTVTLDAWTTSTYSGSMSFYQFFTDLASLWDSISFGDANFARVVMTVANAGCKGGVFEGEDGMAVDFRRLVWNDYSDSLRSTPPIKVPGWLLGWEDTDADMLQHYCRCLVSLADTSAARGSMAWQIARHHVGTAMRSIVSSEGDTNNAASTKHAKRVETILKSLYVAKGEGLLRELLKSEAEASSASKLTDEETQRLVARLSSSNVAQ